MFNVKNIFSSSDEDAGVILSVILDTKNKTNFLLVLNASNFEEQAIAMLPCYSPFGLHGSFYPE